MKDFTDKYLIKTTDGNDRINKNTMYELYKQQNPKSLITLAQLIDALKKSDTKIEYNKDLRNKDNTRGAFFGVKFRNQYNDDDEDEYNKLPLETQIKNLENQKYGIEQLILKLKQQLPVTKNDFDVKENIEIKADSNDEKPQKSKKITKVKTSGKKKYIDPDDKKTYEYDEDDELDCDIKLF